MTLGSTLRVLVLISFLIFIAVTCSRSYQYSTIRSFIYINQTSSQHSCQHICMNEAKKLNCGNFSFIFSLESQYNPNMTEVAFSRICKCDVTLCRGD